MQGFLDRRSRPADSNRDPFITRDRQGGNRGPSVSTRGQEIPACCPHCGGLLGTPEDGLGQGDVYAESTRGLTTTKTTSPTKTTARVRSAGRLIVLDGDLVAQVMSRLTEATAARERCTRGWRGQSCTKRTCSICGVVWARDWRRVLLEALQAPGVPVVMSRGDSSGRGGSAVGRGVLRASWPARARRAPWVPCLSARAGGMVARYLEAVEATSQCP